jgi:tetratricopeptide (TPR) repeat protein
MLCCATVPAGGHREREVPDALRSADAVADLFLLLDSGTADEAIRVARDLYPNKVRVELLPFRWTGGESCTAARNFGLERAHQLGYRFALELDTDERLHPNGQDLRAILESTTADVVGLRSVAGGYSKDRFIRLPAAGQYVGDLAHEYYSDVSNRVILERARFSEVPKPEAQQRARMADVLARMAQAVTREPRCGRWYYYLGDAQAWHGQDREAADSFERCLEVSDWPHEAAWAAFRAGRLLVRMGDHQRCLDLCGRAIARQPGMGELAWLAGVASLALGRVQDAGAWADTAIAWGEFMGRPKPIRAGFCCPEGLWEWPFELLATVLEATGQDLGARQAAEYAAKAKEKRISEMGETNAT